MDFLYKKKDTNLDEQTSAINNPAPASPAGLGITNPDSVGGKRKTSKRHRKHRKTHRKHRKTGKKHRRRR